MEQVKEWVVFEDWMVGASKFEVVLGIIVALVSCGVEAAIFESYGVGFG